MEKKMSVKCPSVPNFLVVGTHSLSITEFSEEELREVGKEWTERLIEHAAEIRAHKDY